MNKNYESNKRNESNESNNMSIEEQQKVIDNLRSTIGIDYTLVLSEANQILQKRRENKQFTATNYPNIAKYPHFIKSLESVEYDRLDEFESVMLLMITKLIESQKGQVSLKQVREKIFEQDLASKYYKK